MRIKHWNRSPLVHKTAWVAPNATLVGRVVVGPGSCVLYGAVLNAEGGAITIGSESVVMEHAVVRASKGVETKIGDHVLVGPHAHCSSCTIESEAFVATGASVFNGAVIGRGAEVRIRGVVHVNSKLGPGEIVPIGWIALGDPATAYPPGAHDEFLPVQDGLDFPRTVFGLERAPEGGSIMPEAMARYARSLGRHAEDEVL